jgi:CheY-like chemotaxis protein
VHAATTPATDPEASAAPKRPEGAQAPALIVDDSKVSQHLAGGLIQRGTGRPIVYAKNGLEAMALLDAIEPCVVLTDLHMPEMNGIELVEAIRATHPRIPVILMTAYGSEDSAMSALQAGASHYVPKKNLIKDLVDTVREVLSVIERDRTREKLLAYQTSRNTTFEMRNDPELLTPLVGIIQEDLDAFAVGDETARMRVAVALREALANALYHGNLECSTDLRQHDERVFYNLADQRRAAEPYRSRRVHVESRVDREGARIVIRDEGVGFDVKSIEKPFDPEDLMKVGGRGMILIRTFLDEVFHNAAGNQITLIKRK